jgi:hypothetical protein
VATPDGGIVAAGRASGGGGSTDAVIVKFDAAGTKQWGHWQGGPNIEGYVNVRQTADGGFIAVGCDKTTQGANRPAGLIAKYNAAGVHQWSYVIGPGASNGESELFSDVVELSDGSLMVAGITQSYGPGGGDGWLLKLNTAGAVQWAKTVGGAADYDELRHIHELPSGNFIVIGDTGSYGAGGGDGWVIEFDTAGTVLSARTIGGGAAEQFTGSFLAPAGEWLGAGMTASSGAGLKDVWVGKFDNTMACCDTTNLAITSQAASPGTATPVAPAILAIAPVSQALTAAAVTLTRTAICP